MEQSIDNEILEGEEGLEGSSEDIGNIYPNAEVRVEKAQYSILHLKKLCEDRKELIIAPDFQRADVWKGKQPSELVESILMGIPIPIMYLFETKDGKRQVVDGRQRITSILNFLNDGFALHELKILKDLNKRKFSGLDPKMQGIFEDYQLSFYIIQPPTPERVKYDIFDRVNRGGTRLNNQEMRNALYIGKATRLIDDLRRSDAFLDATNRGVNPQRMRDKYIILRAIAFNLLRRGKLNTVGKEGAIEYKSDMDDFLAKVMIFINEHASQELIEECKQSFLLSMKNIYHTLGPDAFRFEGGESRRPINMPLFEALTYLFTFDIVNNKPEYTKQQVTELKRQFDESHLFNGNVDSTLNVDKRFQQIESFIRNGLSL